MDKKLSPACISIFTKEEDQYIRDNYQTKSGREIGDILGYRPEQILSRANVLGLHKQRVFNNRYFLNIDTPEKAYWLGFLYADGNVHIDVENHNYEISMNLQRDDRYILERLNSIFGNVFKIKDKDTPHRFIIDRYCDTQLSTLRMYSKQMANDLIKNGVVPDKTHRKEYPIVRDNLFIDFFRGYYDGNGCISGSMYYRKRRWRMNITTPNGDFALFCQKKLSELYGIESKVYKLNDLKYRVCIFKISAMKQLGELMYADDNSPKLLRKYNIYISNLGPQVEKSA